MDLVDRSSRVLITSAVFVSLATVFVALRCISKFAIRRRADVDDWVTIVAWVSVTSHCQPFASHVHPPPIPTISDRTISNLSSFCLLAGCLPTRYATKGVTRLSPAGRHSFCLENASRSRRS